MTPTMAQAREALQRCFGYPDFRRGQVEVVAAVLSGADTLGVLPTGGGKSLCYQVPALVLPGLTVVVSPLISLMKDQVDRLEQRGVPAAFLNSTLEPEAITSRLKRAIAGELKLLYVAPERLEGAEMQRSLRACSIALLAVDEAHCISEWGHEFRPSFRRIAAVRAALGIRQVVALTATATPVVRDDIARQLSMAAPRVIVGGFDRPNLSYAVRSCRSDEEKDAALLTAVQSHARPAVVYASTRNTVQRLARQLSRSGVRAVAYHGGLDDDLRLEAQDAFMAGRVDAIVATNAFGMGIDKPNVRLVAHYAMPGTLEAYYQEAGRAGRDGLPGRCVLLHAPEDRGTHEFFIRAMFPEREVIERTYATLRAGQVAGRAVMAPTGKDADASIRFLLQCRVLLKQPTMRGRVHVRLLATPTRVRRELAGPGWLLELGVLRGLWRHGAQQGTTVQVDRLSPGIPPRSIRGALERLRDRQFVDFTEVGGGIYLARPDATLAELGVDWNALERRRASETAKLDMMERYTRTSECRRGFVLRYFGESQAMSACGGCDNCV
jgi:ATP-dependent DNA helicase RecQ